MTGFVISLLPREKLTINRMTNALVPSIIFDI